MKHFYLRNAAGFPVCCVATEVVSDMNVHDTRQITIRYARSVYNLKDAKPRVGVTEGERKVYFAIPALPYDPVDAIRKAEGRLKSGTIPNRINGGKESVVLTIEGQFGVNNRIGVKQAVVEHIAQHDTSQYAREAAQLWIINAMNEQPSSADAPRPGETVCEHGERPFECITCHPRDGTNGLAVVEPEPAPTQTPTEMVGALDEEDDVIFHADPVEDPEFDMAMANAGFGEPHPDVVAAIPPMAPAEERTAIYNEANERLMDRLLREETHGDK